MTAALQLDLLASGEVIAPALASDLLCATCHRRPRHAGGKLSRCLVCIRSRAEEDRRDRIAAESRVAERAKAQKQCRTCREILPLDAFKPAPLARDCRRRDCKQCVATGRHRLPRGRPPRVATRAPKPPKVPKPATASLIGRTFGRLVAIEYVSRSKWRCRCECGQEHVTTRACLVGGESRSCGCLQRELVSRRSTRHGHERGCGKSPTYRTWFAMLARCHNPNSTAYKRYGGRGIKVCERWRNSFAAFLEDMGERPQKHSIDRWPNNAGNYEPGNTRWATAAQQAANKRSRAMLISHQGETGTLKQWAAIAGLSDRTIRQRLRNGWSVSDALTKPTQRGRPMTNGIAIRLKAGAAFKTAVASPIA